MPGTHVPQRVTFLYRGVRLGTELPALLGEEFDVDVITSPVELVKRPPTDVVVVDVPAADRPVACEAVRRHHRGPLIVLLSQGDSSHDLPPDQNRTLLRHPFSIRRLSVALAETAPTRPALDPARHLQLLPLQAAPVVGTSSNRGAGPAPVAHAVPRLGRRWRQRRLVRVLAISVVAVPLFVGAFAAANYGGRCGAPGCDALAGTDLAAPSTTTVPVPAVQAGPATTGGRVDPTTTSDPGVGSMADGESGVDGAGGTTPIAGSSPSSGGSPGPSSQPDPTRPQSTAAPTTAASTTTRPKSSTSTSTSTSTTTTTTEPTTTTSRGP